jgi:coronin-1B/1C/6
VDLTGIGGGALAVIPLTERGKLPDIIPLFKGHSGPVLDTDFHPFNDSVLASASEDGKVHPTPSSSIPKLIS